MAQRTLVVLTDDLTGDDVAEGNGQTVQFGWKGKAYEIDLTNTNVDKFEKAIGKYVEAAREVKNNVTSIRGRGSASPRAGMSPARADKEQVQAMREWAKNNGFTVSDRGRIPQVVIEAYHAAHSA